MGLLSPSRDFEVIRVCSVLFLFLISLPVFKLDAQHTYKHMLDDPSVFNGPMGKTVDPETLPYIAIGLFSPDDPTDEAAQAVYRGMLLALEQANSRGGYKGTTFKLIQRWASDPWAAGSREMIKLAYEDNVWAVISYSGGASHIAQQIAAKVFLPIVSPVSTSLSLTRARVPWMFRLPPDDRTQARKIIVEAFPSINCKRIGIISSTDHDNRATAAEIIKEMKRRQSPPLFHFQVANDTTGFQAIVSRMKRSSPEGMVLLLPVSELVSLLHSMQEEAISYPVALPWQPGIKGVLKQTGYKGHIYILDPLSMRSQLNNSSLHAFNTQYRGRFKMLPPPCAVYAYDAARLIIKAIQTAGLNRTAIRDAIAGLSGFQGASGTINWDNSGSNSL